MTDIPIIFSAPMVRALLDGRKTMTRRLAWKENFTLKDGRTRKPSPWQKVKPGDRLWVREASAYINNEEFNDTSYWQYRADTDGKCFPGDWPEEERDNPERPRWKPAIHMPRVASRLTLYVTDKKIERLQDISEADAEAEGIARAFTKEECKTAVGIIGTKPEDHGWNNYLWHGHHGNYGLGNAKSDAWPHQYSTYKDARGSFSSLWASLHGPESWNANPEVVALTFNVHKRNIDAHPKSEAA